jgi:hypothetical protein
VEIEITDEMCKRIPEPVLEKYGVEKNGHRWTHIVVLPNYLPADSASSDRLA